MNFGESFRKARIAAGMSQNFVAEKLNIYQSNVSDWENDVSRQEHEKLIELSKLYDVTL